MQSVHKTLTELRTRMAAALPHRIVKDDYVDFHERRREELLRGIVSVVLPEVEAIDDWACMAQVTIVGQIEVQTRDGQPSAGELAEQILAGEIRAFLRNTGGDLPHISVTRIGYSAQQEHPQHWCAFKCTMGPINEADDTLQDGQLYPPWVNPTLLAGIRINIDAEPYESKTEQDKWLAGDYSTSQPDATLTVEFNHANTIDPTETNKP